MAKGIYVGASSKARKVTKAYVGVSEDSLVFNGDFSDGLNEWVPISSSNYLDITVENGVLKYSANTTVPNGDYSDGVSVTNKSKSISPNDILYFSCNAKIKGATSTLRFWLASSGTEFTFAIRDGAWHKVSDTVTVAISVTSIFTCRLYCDGYTSGDVCYIDDVRVYNLTALYGAGNEPTKEWCDNNLEALKNLYKLQNSKARKIKKGYIGVGGVAQLFYSAENLVPFTSNPAPTSWTSDSERKTATATNDYGKWNISTTHVLLTTSSTHGVLGVFDSSATTYLSTGELGTAKCTVRLDLPEGVLIKPSEITIKYIRCASLSGVWGVLEDGTTAKISNLTSSSSSITDTLNPDIGYCKAFYIDVYKSSSYTTHPYIYDFKINKGTIKIVE